MKTCARCKAVKPASGFYRSAQTRDGLYPYCRVCQLEAGRVSRATHGWKYAAKRAALTVANRPVHVCTECGLGFNDKRLGAKVCGDDCRAKRNARLEKLRPRRLSRVCEVCGDAYAPSYSKQRTCDRVCGGVLRARARKPKPPKVVEVRWRCCPICGADFVAARGRTYCEPACTAEAARRYAVARTKRGEDHACECGTPLPPRRHKCDDCKRANAAVARRRSKQRRRALKLGVPSEVYTLAEIAARDGCRCGICSRKVAMSKSVPHPKAPTIDHVLQFVAGGDDTRANVQLAHFLCNSIKGGYGEQQLAFFREPVAA